VRTISETPRTDSNSNSVIGFWTCATVPTSFARELERENTKLKEMLMDASRRGDMMAAHWKERAEKAEALIQQLHHLAWAIEEFQDTNK